MSGSNALPPIQVKIDGAQTAQQAIDGLVAAADRMGAVSARTAGQVGTLRTQAEQAGGALRNTGQIIGQAGYQVQDFAVQVASGQSALTAFVQQGSQLAGVFGPAGIIVGAGIAIAGVAAQILLGRDATKAWNDALKEQQDSLRRVADEAERWREGMGREATQVRQLTEYYNSLSEARRSVEIRDVLRQQGTLNDREAVLRRDIEGNVGALATGARDQLTQARDYARASYPSGSAEQRAALDALDTSDAARRLTELVDTFDRFRASGTLTVEGVAQLSSALRVLGQENDNVGAMARRAADAMERQLPAVRELEGAQRDLTARSQALGVATTGLASGVDTARTAFERLRDVILQNPFRGLDAQIASAQERLGALTRGGLALYEGVQSLQTEQGRSGSLFREWETGRRQELERSGGLTAEQIQARIDAEAPDAGMRAMDLARQEAAERDRVERLRAAARGGGGRPPADPELLAGWAAVQDQRRDMEAADRQEARDWDQEQARREREAERAQERAVEANRRTTDAIVDYGAERFADLFEQNGRGWEGMMETFERTAKSTLARIAAEMILRPIIAPIVQGLGLGGLGGGAGGFSGLGGLIGGGGGATASGGGLGQIQSVGSLFNLGGSGGGGMLGGVGSFLSTPLWGGATSISSLPAVPTASSMAGVVPMAGPSIAGLAAGIGGGYMIGSTLGGYIAKSDAQRTNSQIGAASGAAAGALIGSIIPGVGTVIGGLVGGAIGGGGGGMIGPGSQFSGGDVGIGVGADGLFRVTGTGGKRWDSGAAQQQTQQQLDQINAVLRAGGITIQGVGGYDWDRGSGGQTIGFAGSGDSKQVFGPTEMFARVRSGLTSSNDNMRTALKSSVVQSFDDIGNVAQWLASTFEPLSKVTDYTKNFADAIAAQNKVYDDAIARARELGLAESGLVAAREKSLSATLGARDTSVHNALQSLRIDELRSTGNARDAREATQIEFALSSSQRLTQLQDFLRGNGYGDETSLFQSSVARLNALFDTQRKTLAAQSGFGSGSALMEELTVGGLGGLTSAGRYAAGMKLLQDARASGDLDRISAAARSVLPVARDYLGTSERFGGLVADISRDVRKLGGDPVGLGVFLEGQAAANMTLDRIYSLGNSQLSELRGMRTEIARLNAVITTLMQRQAA